MHREGEEIHVTSTEARGGSESNVVRYVLVISLTLAILALSAVWITGALNAPQGSHTAAVTNQSTPLR